MAPKSIDLKIKDDILKRTLSLTAIGEKHGVGYYRVSSLYRELYYLGVLQEKDIEGVCGMLPRLEPYFTEEELLYPSSPYYGATNKRLLTPIQKDWKLY